ncbi:PP2A-widerborst subunit, partial [Reticulomyxa filosa]
EQNHQLARGAKRQCLIELVEYISQSKQWCSEEVMPYVFEMLSRNLFRALPPPMYDDFDPEEDEPNFDPSWPHMQFVYEFFNRVIMTTDVTLIRKHMDKGFVLHMIDLFTSDDPREREYLKMILHRIYGRCMNLRCFIRKGIHNVLLPVIYQNFRHNGISELLEILGSIINGFATPLKKEHIHFFHQVLIPLHKAPAVSQFHQQLAYCVTQFIQKDLSLSGAALSGILKFWPVTPYQKEILFLNELEEVIELTATPQIEIVVEPLFRRIAAAISSTHFQVAERALFLWNNDVIATFTSDHRDQILPIIFPALQQNYANHWNTTVSSLTLNIIRIFKEMDKELYEDISKKYKSQKGNTENKADQRAEKWKKLREQHVTA